MSYINIADVLWPVGSLYWTRNHISPSELFDGTWVQIQDSIIYPTTQETYDTNIVDKNSFTIYSKNLPDAIMWSCFTNSFNREEIKADYDFRSIQMARNGDGSSYTIRREREPISGLYPTSPGYDIEYIPARTLCHCYQRIA